MSISHSSVSYAVHDLHGVTFYPTLDEAITHCRVRFGDSLKTCQQHLVMWQVFAQAAHLSPTDPDNLFQVAMIRCEVPVHCW